jgi:N-acetylglucosaminyldiphosphoundecaprenol N-acetyl-beta-D-mannosaminyltransferase
MQSSSVTILGCRIDNVDWADIDTFCRQALTESTPQHIVTINGEQILAAEQNNDYRVALNSADLIIPDSTNVSWVSRWKGSGLKAITPGSDLTLRLAKLAAELDKSIFLVGSKPGVAAEAAKALQQHYPGLKIAGTSSANPSDQTVISEINKSRADIVLVAYGAPAHDLWIQKHKIATGAKILVGVGGTFDMLAGNLPRAPRFMRSLHLEWLWRLILQPSRIGRIWNAVVVFPLKAILSD